MTNEEKEKLTTYISLWQVAFLMFSANSLVAAASTEYYHSSLVFFKPREEILQRFEPKFCL